jgi:hypothetical protein
VAAEDWRPDEHPLEGWEEFRVTDRQDEVIRGRFHTVNELGRWGVRFMFGKDLDDPEWSLVRIHPGESGLDPVRCSTFSLATRVVITHRRPIPGADRSEGPELVRAGSARHRQPLALGGHKRAQPVRRNRSSLGLHRYNLQRRNRVGPGSNPISYAGRISVVYRAGGRDQGVSGLGWSSPSTQMSARSL